MKLLRISQYVGSNYVIALLGFMMSFLTTKLVGPDYFGLLASILLYSDWLHILILLGLDQSFLRYGINWDVGAKIGFIQSLISILFLILISFFVLFYFVQLPIFALIVALNSFFLAVSRLLIVYYRLGDSLRQLNLLTILVTIVTKICTVILFSFNFDIIEVLVIVTSLNIFLLLFFLRDIGFKFKFKLNGVNSYPNNNFLSYGLKALIATLIYVVILGFPIFFIGHRDSVSNLGLFNLSMTLSSLLAIGLNGLKTVFPVIIFSRDNTYMDKIEFLILLVFVCLTFIVGVYIFKPVMFYFLDKRYFGLFNYLNFVVLIIFNSFILELYAYKYNKLLRQTTLIVENILFLIILATLYLLNMNSLNTMLFYVILLASFSSYRAYVLLGLNNALFKRVLVVFLFNGILLSYESINLVVLVLVWFVVLFFIIFKYGHYLRLWFRKSKLSF